MRLHTPLKLFDYLTEDIHKSNIHSVLSLIESYCPLKLYNEEIIDLLAEDRGASKGLRIHEDHKGEIYLQGATNVPVKNAHEVPSFSRLAYFSSC